MKNLIKLLLACLLVGSQLAGCDTASTAAVPVCADMYTCTNSGSVAQACCTDTSCWYDAGPTNFYCSSTYDCSSAASSLVNYCYNKTTAKSETDLAAAMAIEKTNNVQLRRSIDEMYIDLGNEVQQDNQ